MPALHIPKFPVVDPDPPLSRAASNFSFRDYSAIAGFAAAGFTCGWFGGNLNNNYNICSELTNFFQQEDSLDMLMQDSCL